MRNFIRTSIALALFATASAQEARTWTDLKGRKIDGAFVKQDHATVWIRRDDGSELPIPKKSLSDADQKHLLEAPVASPSAGKRGRFNTVALDPAAWKPRVDGFQLETLIYIDNLETEHFIIGASPKTRPAMLLAYAEAAERLWADIASDIPQLDAAFAGKRLPILLIDGEKDANRVAEWHVKHAGNSSDVSPNYNLDTFVIVGFTLDSEFADEAGLTHAGRLFRMDSKVAQHARKTWPQRVHFLTDDIIRQMIRGTKDNGGYSLSMVRLAFNYHREELVCGRIESEVTFGGGSEVEGFKNGRNWAGATKKLLKAGARPDIDAFLKTKGANAEPRDLGFGLGLMRFIHADPARLAGLGSILETAGSTKKSPDPEAFAKALGFDSPAALDEAWRAYMESADFE